MRFLKYLCFCLLILFLTIVSFGKIYAKGCDCWVTGYQEDWIHQENPSSGKHAVIWFKCNKVNSNPIVTTDLVWKQKRNWMVWSDNNNKNYQVFVNGWYYYYLRWIQRWRPDEIFYTVHLE